jgi:Phosphoribosyl transferase (PRTase)/PELOTA RNA binding domain
LQHSLARYACRQAQSNSLAKDLANELFVLCDLAGIATACGSTEDYLIPSAILNATVCGLVSRTVLNEAIQPGQFHGCVYYDGLAAHDRSRWFVERWRTQVLEDRERLRAEPSSAPDLAQVRTRSERLVRDLMQRYGVADRNFIKPGIGEATRSMLRRMPRLLLLRDADAPSVRHLQWLASQRAVPVSLDPDLPLNAATILRKLADA